MELRLPQEKLSKLKKLLSEWQLKKVCSRKKPKSLLGHLNDACSVVKPGRLFIGRLSPFSQKQNANIETSVGLTVRPQMAAHVHWILERHLHPAMSSLKSSRPWVAERCLRFMGCRYLLELRLDSVSVAICLSTRANCNQRTSPIAIATLWGRQWKGTTVRANCDNEAAVTVIYSGYSRDPFVMHVLRCIFFFSATFDFNLTANITKSCLPITPNYLLKLRSVWEKEASNIMQWAACCTYYFWFLRSGKISIPSDREYDPSTHLSFGDTAADSHENTSTIAIKIKASKTDPLQVRYYDLLGSDKIPIYAP